ncbi:MAG: hypothetical protein HC935_02935 [Pseudanabaena sp. SU_2_4]|nr:hypothetical protein [Pseudanabaena sp. SU_2_4]
MDCYIHLKFRNIEIILAYYLALRRDRHIMWQVQSEITARHYLGKQSSHNVGE